jgi:transposase
LAVEVVDAPSSDKAILAAMSAKAALPTDIERLRQMLRFVEPPLKDTVNKHQVEALDRFEAEDGPASPRSISLLLLSDTYSTLEYIVALLRHHRPGFDGLSWEDQMSLIEETSEKMNEFLGSLRRLQDFLSYGIPNRKLTPSIKEPQRDVDAAVLRDVDGLTHREIGKRLDVPLSSGSQYQQSGHQTVRRAIERGRRILEAAFGKEGWQRQAQAMKTEKAQRQSLSEEEQHVEWLAETLALYLDVPLQELLTPVREGVKEGFKEREPRRSE